MNHKTIKRNISRLEKQLQTLIVFLKSWPLRYRVWLDGCHDGAHGSFDTPEAFRKLLLEHGDSDSIARVRKMAAVAIAKAEELFERETVQYRELLPKVQVRIRVLEDAMDEIARHTGDAICHEPRLSPRQYFTMLVLFCVTEAAFSIPSLRWSNLGNTWEEVVLAIVAAIIIVAIAHYLGLDLRRFPLARGVSSAHRNMLAVKAVSEGLALTAALLTLTYFRWRGMQAQNSGGDASNWSTYALFVLGSAFAFAAVVSAYETEYSGPRFGLDGHKREHRNLVDLVLAINTAFVNIDRIRKNFRDVVDSRVAALRAAHLRRYVRSWKPASSARQLNSTRIIG